VRPLAPLVLQAGHVDEVIFACSGRFKRKELTRVLPDHATVGAPLNLVYPSARFLPKRVALLRDQLLKEPRPRLDV
jgi:hypothetical protein